MIYAYVINLGIRQISQSNYHHKQTSALYDRVRPVSTYRWVCVSVCFTARLTAYARAFPCHSVSSTLNSRRPPDGAGHPRNIYFAHENAQDATVHALLIRNSSHFVSCRLFERNNVCMEDNEHCNISIRIERFTK